MQSVLRPFLLRFMRRDPSEIARQARSFGIRTEDGHQLVECLGRAFIAGFNAMLREERLDQVAAEGLEVVPHFRPFFFEGAAMGYLPRRYLWPGCSAGKAEQELLEMNPGYRYLYYVGLGFWLGMRHPGKPSSLESLAAHLDPMYFPLCYDGFGFKVGFYHHADARTVERLFDRCPPESAAVMRQGFGRAMFFVHMHDDSGFEKVQGAVAPEHRLELEFGRSLAAAFTQVNRPLAIARHIAAADSAEDRAARLTGVTWALTAREMNDPNYFGECLSLAPKRTGDLLRGLPAACREALALSRTYGEWQRRTRGAVVRLYESFGSSLAVEAQES